jgi:hypothetical protein
MSDEITCTGEEGCFCDECGPKASGDETMSAEEFEKDFETRARYMVANIKRTHEGQAIVFAEHQLRQLARAAADKERREENSACASLCTRLSHHNASEKIRARLEEK